jgi:hypothetical protein
VARSLGLAWGWLPCGMTYSMLLLAATTASVSLGAAVMFAFGLGTLPSMVTATVRSTGLRADYGGVRAASRVLLLPSTPDTDTRSTMRRGGGHEQHPNGQRSG